MCLNSFVAARTVIQSKNGGISKGKLWLGKTPRDQVFLLPSSEANKTVTPRGVLFPFLLLTDGNHISLHQSSGPVLAPAQEAPASAGLPRPFTVFLLSEPAPAPHSETLRIADGGGLLGDTSAQRVLGGCWAVKVRAPRGLRVADEVSRSSGRKGAQTISRCEGSVTAGGVGVGREESRMQRQGEGAGAGQRPGQGPQQLPVGLQGETYGKAGWV